MSPDDFRQRRKALGLTQSELGKLLDRHASHISDWERSAAPIPPIVWLALEALESRRIVQSLRQALAGTSQ